MKKCIIRETVVKRAKEYYENDIERLREQVKNKYRELSEEKNIKTEYWRNKYQNMSEEKKED